jgi:hypothetical protein
MRFTLLMAGISALPRSPEIRQRPAGGRIDAEYFFHLAGALPAHDLLGYECANYMEARDHGGFIAHRIGTEKPGMVCEGNFISVRDEPDREIALALQMACLRCR